ncbi:Solute carrier family 12 member 2 [Acropora cervicornis]|uniref:Solute carrier family 12 member 2 n=1 Tax=Acropora cervicornis TaxID=6130 RepID=A0AAD9QZF4_ACRCE|nr:Solute carrier family 12 member 2 [Acropora cervicornis]
MPAKTSRVVTFTVIYVSPTPSSSTTASILDEDEYSKSKPPSSPTTKSTQQERVSLSSPDKHSPEISEDRVETSLKEKQRGTGDVWWIYDDGGLTVLIPGKSTRKHRSASSASGLGVQKLTTQIEGISKKPSKESIDSFKRLPVRQQLGDAPIEDQKVLRSICIRELVRYRYTPDTRLVVISLPVPVNDVTTPLMDMSWL